MSSLRNCHMGVVDELQKLSTRYMKVVVKVHPSNRDLQVLCCSLKMYVTFQLKLATFMVYKCCSLLLMKA